MSLFHHCLLQFWDNNNKYIFAWSRKKVFPASYVIIFAFRPDLTRDHIIVGINFGDDLEKLTDVSYLNRGI